jgi:hypothetical protein
MVALFYGTAAFLFAHQPGRILLAAMDFIDCAGRRRYINRWGWLGSGGFPGLQNRWRVALRAAVGSTPIRSRLQSC